MVCLRSFWRKIKKRREERRRKKREERRREEERRGEDLLRVCVCV